MAENEVTQEMFDQALAKIIDVSEQTRVDHLQQTALARTKDAETFQLEKEALEKKLGPDHPRVQALDRASQSAGFVAQFAHETVNFAGFDKDSQGGVPITIQSDPVQGEQNSGCLSLFKRAPK